MKPRGEAEPELNLLLSKSTLEEPLWKSLFQNLDEFFFPKKLPPLVLTSKPVPVKDIWGFYDYKKNGVLGSTIVHMLAIAAIIGITLLGRRVVQQIVKPHEAITLVSPDDIPPLQPSKTLSGGGGGGGDRDKFQAPKGKLPKQSMEQITPPMMVVRNDNPKLTAEPTVVVPPQVKLATNSLPNLGDPMSHLPSGPPSNGTGSGGGIGSGSGGGVGVGTGPGVGEGRGGGVGGGVFRVGGGVPVRAGGSQRTTGLLGVGGQRPVASRRTAHHPGAGAAAPGAQRISNRYRGTKRSPNWLASWMA